ncbi:hypothetical protein ACFL2Q_19960, partial [Thermodesulfobacteriota bacterium]
MSWEARFGLPEALIRNPLYSWARPRAGQSLNTHGVYDMKHEVAVEQLPVACTNRRDSRPSCPIG